MRSTCVCTSTTTLLIFFLSHFTIYYVIIWINLKFGPNKRIHSCVALASEQVQLLFLICFLYHFTIYYVFVWINLKPGPNAACLGRGLLEIKGRERFQVLLVASLFPWWNIFETKRYNFWRNEIEIVRVIK